MTLTKESFYETKIAESEVLPVDWSEERLENVAKITSGGSAPQGDKYFEGDNPFVRVQHIELDSGRITHWDLIPDEAVKKYKLKRYPKGTIVFPKSGASIYLEKRAMLPMDAYIVSHLCAVNADSSKTIQKYLFFASKHITFSKDKADGYPTLNLSEIKLVHIPIPPLLEQQRISSVLSTIQEAKEKTENVIRATKEFKKSMMKHLFTYGPVSIEDAEKVPLKETEFGMIPEHWEVVKVGDVAEIVSGGTPSRNEPIYWNGTIPWVKTGEISYKVISMTKEKITDEGLNKSSARIIPKGTLLMAMYGQGVTRGKVAILGIDASINQACAAFLLPDFIDTYFLFHFFTFHYYKIRSFGHGAHQKNLSATLIKLIDILIPPMLEQKQTAEILSAIDEKINAEQTKKNSLDTLFKTLLSLLMTGKLRVKDLEIPV